MNLYVWVLGVAVLTGEGTNHCKAFIQYKKGIGVVAWLGLKPARGLKLC